MHSRGACFQNTLVRFRASPDVDPKSVLTIFRGYMLAGKCQKIALWTTNIAHLGALLWLTYRVSLYSAISFWPR